MLFNPVWIAFIVGLFIGTNIGLVILATLVISRRPRDHDLPDIEGV